MVGVIPRSGYGGLDRTDNGRSHNFCLTLQSVIPYSNTDENIVRCSIRQSNWSCQVVNGRTFIKISFVWFFLLLVVPTSICCPPLRRHSECDCIRRVYGLPPRERPRDSDRPRWVHGLLHRRPGKGRRRGVGGDQRTRRDSQRGSRSIREEISQ